MHLNNALDVQPISPKDAIFERKKSIPSSVISAFNILIVKNMDLNNVSTITQNEAINEIAKQFLLQGQKISREEIFKNAWLDIENIFSDIGWHVEYDKPMYFEEREAVFEFSVKK